MRYNASQKKMPVGSPIWDFSLKAERERGNTVRSNDKMTEEVNVMRDNSLKARALHDPGLRIGSVKDGIQPIRR